MKRTYRGAQYQPKCLGHPTKPTAETGCYRNAKLQFREIQSPPTVVGFATLTYRGANYKSPRYSQSKPIATESAVTKQSISISVSKVPNQDHIEIAAKQMSASTMR